MPPTYVPVIRTGVDVSFNNVTVAGVLSLSGGATYNGGTIRGNGSTSTSTLLAGMVSGDQFDRWRLDTSGMLNLGPGNATRDTNLYRAGVGTLKTDTSLRVGGSLGVGNSLAATTPGAVVRKVELFDAAGVSLGFLPVYNSIT
jgi:hypothetical protein